MAHNLLVAGVVLGLFLGGCSRKSRPDSAPPPPSAKTETAPVRANSGARIDCDKLIPVALREKLFPGLTMTQQPLCADCPEQCRFSTPGSPLGTAVLYDCRGTLDSVSRPTMEAGGWKEVKSLGKLAFAAQDQITFWDETDCQVTVSEQGGSEARLLEIAGPVEKALTPAAVGR
jgi:hypothetical protein